MKDSIKLIAFDMDGVILDSMEELSKLAVWTIIQTYGILPDKATTKYNETVGLPFRGQLEAIFPGDARNNDADFRYESRHLALAPTFGLTSSIKEYLFELDKKYITVLVSSTDHHIVCQTKALDLPFYRIIGYPPTKEHQIRQSASHYNTHLSDILYVGDSPSDAVLAEKLGTQFLKVNAKTTVSALREYFGFCAAKSSYGNLCTKLKGHEGPHESGVRM